eukprot:m.121626 g.121626  ORF g.121626 m.121626 type:complete len:472 (-) comp19633_c0_seq2:84-1499(-)
MAEFDTEAMRHKIEANEETLARLRLHQKQRHEKMENSSHHSSENEAAVSAPAAAAAAGGTGRITEVVQKVTDMVNKHRTKLAQEVQRGQDLQAETAALAAQTAELDQLLRALPQHDPAFFPKRLLKINGITLERVDADLADASNRLEQEKSLAICPCYSPPRAVCRWPDPRPDIFNEVALCMRSDVPDELQTALSDFEKALPAVKEQMRKLAETDGEARLKQAEARELMDTLTRLIDNLEKLTEEDTFWSADRKISAVENISRLVACLKNEAEKAAANNKPAESDLEDARVVLAMTKEEKARVEALPADTKAEAAGADLVAEAEKSSHVLHTRRQQLADVKTELAGYLARHEPEGVEKPAKDDEKEGRNERLHSVELDVGEDTQRMCSEEASRCNLLLEHLQRMVSQADPKDYQRELKALRDAKQQEEQRLADLQKRLPHLCEERDQMIGQVAALERDIDSVLSAVNALCF